MIYELTVIALALFPIDWPIFLEQQFQFNLWLLLGFIADLLASE